MNLRDARIEDLESIVDIYNQAIESQFSTADTTKKSINDRFEWFHKHKSYKYPIYVCEIENSVVGWISVSPYRAGRKALRFTAEISYYIHKDFRRQGLAGELIKFTTEKCKELNYKTLFAIIIDKNIASIDLIEKCGFEKWGHLPNIADFDGLECGHLYYGQRIKE
ncbi:MAG: GNAT family N-acetyltransferase [Candidatus Kapabacteria bacterium]|nr:GNAT family N-acetyltransferase [Candidatus Kapabacteria bacterium]